MSSDSSSDLTGLLHDWSHGDRSALDRLVALVEPELRRMARGFLRNERPGHILQTTALINEAYLGLIGPDGGGRPWRDRVHFFGMAARIMRNILVDHARRAQCLKRGERREPIPLDDALDVAHGPTVDPAHVIDGHNALGELEALDAQQAHIVELRYFGGLTVAEIAAFLEIPEHKVWADWALAKAWLGKRLLPR